MILGLALAVLAGQPLTAAPAPVTAPSDMSMGNPKARVTVVEYGSVACPFCAHFNETVLPDLKAKYIDTGKINYVYRPMLTGVQTIAASGELLAECAGKDKYFTVIDAIMRGQHEFYAMGENDMLSRPVLLRIANSVGIDEKGYVACTTDAAAFGALKDRYHAYLAAGFTSTPSFEINGKRFDYKGDGIAEFDAAIAAAQ
ncbi:MAG: thioredoxin domain-containing protein [Asticcacaulis sp.]